MSSVFDRYQPIGPLDVGPLGQIYTALEKAANRKVAFRGFSRPPDAEPNHWQQAIDLYTRELTLARSLDHPNIARVFEFGEENGIYFVITEWFDAEALRRKLERGEKFTVDQALNIIGQAGRAFEYAAERGTYHGDVTPYNLLLLSGGPGTTPTVKVVNFGLAHCRPKEDSVYRAPEEILGYEGDPRSDLFGLGVILYQMLTGAHPFAAASAMETRQRILTAPTPAVPSAPPYLQSILQKLLAKRVEDRYQSWAEAALDIAQARAPAPPPQREADPLPPNPRATQQPSLAHYQLGECDALRIRKDVYDKKRSRIIRTFRTARRVVTGAAVAVGVLVIGRGFSMRSGEHALSVAAVQGDVRFRGVTQPQWTKVAPRGRLHLLDEVRTGRDSSARLALGDGSRLLLGPNSLLTVREVRFRSRTHTRARVFSLARGTVYAMVRKRPRQQFAILTPTGKAVVKGTEFSVSVRGAGFQVATLSGLVEARNEEGTVQVAPGQQTLLRPDAKPSKPAEVPETQEQALQTAIGQLRRNRPGEALATVLNALQDATITPLADIIPGIEHLSNLGVDTLKQGGSRARAQGSMQALVYALEMANLEDGYPESLDLKSLKELALNDEARERILASFKDKKLEAYQRLPNGYEVKARVPDEEGTLVTARNGKVTVKGEE